MRSTPRYLLLAALAAALSACEKDSQSSPWLTYPGVDGHARYLPLLGTSHDPGLLSPGDPGGSCAGCHPGATFTQVVCTGCHGQAATDGLHGAPTAPIADYSWTPPPPAPYQRPSCLASKCHPQGGIPDARHHSFFPVDDASPHSRQKLGTSAGSFCMACHSDPLDKPNLAKLNCVTCHQGNMAVVVHSQLSSHTAVLTPDSYPTVPTSRDCLRCHDGGQVDRVATHGSRQGPAGFGRAGPWDSDPQLCPTTSDKHGCPNQPVTCFKCHNAVPPAFGGTGPGLPSRPWAQDWKIPATSANQVACTTTTERPGFACCECHGVKL